MAIVSQRHHLLTEPLDPSLFSRSSPPPCFQWSVRMRQALAVAYWSTTVSITMMSNGMAAFGLLHLRAGVCAHTKGERILRLYIRWSDVLCRLDLSERGIPNTRAARQPPSPACYDTPDTATSCPTLAPKFLGSQARIQYLLNTSQSIRAARRTARATFDATGEVICNMASLARPVRFRPTNASAAPKHTYTHKHRLIHQLKHRRGVTSKTT